MARSRRQKPPSNRKTFTSKKLTFLDYMARDKRIKPSEFLIGYLITQHVNSLQGYAYPSGQLLTKESKMSISTVKTAVAHLLSLGYFRVFRPYRSSTNRYRPNFEIELLDRLGEMDSDDGQ